jgi:hypothetical protein
MNFLIVGITLEVKARFSFGNHETSTEGHFTGDRFVTFITTALIVGNRDGYGNAAVTFFYKSVDLLVDFFVPFKHPIQQISLMLLLL